MLAAIPADAPPAATSPQGTFNLADGYTRGFDPRWRGRRRASPASERLESEMADIVEGFTRSVAVASRQVEAAITSESGGRAFGAQRYIGRQALDEAAAVHQTFPASILPHRRAAAFHVSGDGMGHGAAGPPPSHGSLRSACGRAHPSLYTFIDPHPTAKVENRDSAGTRLRKCGREASRWRP